VSALGQARSPIDFPLSNVALPLATGVKAYQGAALYLDTATNTVKPGVAGNQNLIPAGTAQETVDNTGGSSTIPVMTRLYSEIAAQWFDNATGGAAITALFSLAYVLDDHTVTNSPVNNSIAGRVWALDSKKGVLVQPLTGTIESVFGGDSPSDGGNLAFTARAVITSLAAYTGSGTGTLTGSANGAIGAQDGVTLLVGNQVFIMEGTANVTAVDSGPWVVSSLGSAGSKYVLKRPSWFFTGATWIPGVRVEIGGEGAFWANCSVKATAAAGVIDTTNAAWYVGRVTFQITLASGTKVLSAGTGGLGGSNCPVGILSASRSNCEVSLNALGGTNTGTVSFGSKALTPGPIGTAAVSLFAFAANMATQSSDASVLNVTIDNGF